MKLRDHPIKPYLYNMRQTLYWCPLWLMVLFTLNVAGQHSLSIRVEGIQSSVGTLQVALYSQEEYFLKMEGIFRAESVAAREGWTEFSIEDIPPGEYAVAIFHDENENEELDTNWIGIPKEPLGFSNARLKTFGPPKFEECKIRLQSDASVVVKMQ